jgi:hypothetical protein
MKSGAKAEIAGDSMDVMIQNGWNGSVCGTLKSGV